MSSRMRIVVLRVAADPHTPEDVASIATLFGAA
jgi:hypothetical protein